ncbi:MAG: type IX secretion system membrane protein PorP/SprF [Bacteroidota bacterium]
MRKRFYITVTLAMFAGFVSAQNDIQLSQQNFSRITYNPAATGNSEYLNVALFAREQWLGYDNAPSTQVLNAHKYFDKYKLGVGLQVVNDKLGIENTFNIKMAYAYHVWLQDKMILSFGLSAGIIYKNLDGTNMILQEANDPLAFYGKSSKLKPDFDFGVELNTPSYGFGASTTHLHTGLKGSDNFNMPRHYYLYGKYNYKPTEDITVIPQLGLNSTQYITIFEVNVVGNYKDLFWAGCSWRRKDAFVIMAGAKIHPMLKIGYAYDIGMGPVKSYSSGSHEIMLIGKFNALNSKYYKKTPRFFD